MTGQAFIRLMREDIETHKDKEVLKNVVDCMEHVAGLHPNCEIDSTKTADECYKKIYEYAKGHKSGECAVVTPDKSIEIVTEYLGLKDAPAAPKVAARVALEDFF